jgi:hypothetical protein
MESQSNLNLKCIVSPYNKWIEPTALGRHAPCALWVSALGQSKGRAGDAAAPGFPAGHLRPCSQVIPVLYGRIMGADFKNKESKTLKNGLWPAAIEGSAQYSKMGME